MSKNIQNLFEEANNDGIISAQSAQILNVRDIGVQIQAGLGINVDDVESSEVVLVTIMPDDSGSINFSNNAQAIRDGHNMVIDALMTSKQKDDILIHCRYLNGDVLYPYCPLDQAVKMDQQNYNPTKGTPLYDQSVVLLGTVLAKTKEFSDNGVPVRTVTLILTDGDDVHSRNIQAKDVATLVKDMAHSENHIVAAIGVDGGNVNFKQVFSDMGLLDEWILTPKSNPTEIKRAFQVFSQSAVRASQSSANFSSIGGFGG